MRLQTSHSGLNLEDNRNQNDKEILSPIYKMEVQRYELKPISHKEFNKFMKGKGFKGRNNYMLKDLKAKFVF